LLVLTIYTCTPCTDSSFPTQPYAIQLTCIWASEVHLHSSVYVSLVYIKSAALQSNLFYMRSLVTKIPSACAKAGWFRETILGTNMADRSTQSVFPGLAGACVLVANRGECACRIIKSCRQLGIATTAVYTEPDRTSLHTRLATRGVQVQSYLDPTELVQVALDTQATAIHPGWGFLSENPEFAEACSSKGISSSVLLQQT